MSKRRLPKLYIVVLMAALLTLTIFVGFSQRKVTARVSIGEVPPSVSLEGLTGKSTIIPADLKDKVAFIHFGTTSCSYCVKEMYALESFYRHHLAEGVVIFSIIGGEDRQSVMRYLSNLKISYPVLVDPDLSVMRRYNVTGVPTTYILDRLGVVRFKIPGEITSDQLDNVARTLL